MALSDQIYADTDSSKYSSRFELCTQTARSVLNGQSIKQQSGEIENSLVTAWQTVWPLLLDDIKHTHTHTHESHDWTERSVWQEVAEEPSSDLCLIRVRLFLSSLSFFVANCWSDSVAETATDRFTSWACSSFWPCTVQVHRKEAVTDFFSHKKTNLKRLI